jgi:hypothetical protein
MIRRCIGVRARRHAVLEIGRVRLRDDVERPRGMLVLVFVRSLDGAGSPGWDLGEEGRMLECGKGRVESAAEGLGEGTSPFGDGKCAGSGHVGGIMRGLVTRARQCGVYIGRPNIAASAEVAVRDLGRPQGVC